MRIRLFALLAVVAALCACSYRSPDGSMMRRALQLANGGRCNEAELIYASFTTAHPKRIEGYKGLALCEEALIQYSLAAYHAGRAIALRPDDYRLYAMRSDIYFNASRMGPAVADEERALQLAPLDETVITTIASKFADMRAYPDAIRALDRVLPSATDKPRLFVVRGTYLREDGRYSEALRQLAKAAKLARARDVVASAYYEQAVTYFNAKDVRDAKSRIERAVSLIGAPSYYILAAKIYDAADLPRNALAAASKAAVSATDPLQLATARKLRADSLIQLGRYKAAAADYQWIVRHSSDADMRFAASQVIGRLNLDRLSK